MSRVTWWGIASLVLLVGCGDGGGSGQTNTLHIGALLSLTGGWSSLGQTSQAAMQVAADDVNAYLHDIGSDLRVAVEVADTQLDPDRAAQALQRFARDGVRVVIGPQSSAEVRAVKPIADDRGVLVVSQGSTAHSLAEPGDNVFRLCPDDQQEGPAIAALMIAEGRTAMVTLTRADDGNRGLQTSTSASFGARGGALAGGVLYPADDSFDPVVTTADVDAAIDVAIAHYGVDAVALYVAGFDEVAQIIANAVDYPSLRAVRWYGSDGVVGSAAFLTPDVAPFASAAGYPSPIFGLDPNAAPLRAPVAEAIETQTGFPPDAFGLSAYDGVWLATLAYLQAGGTRDLARYKDAFTRTAETYFGVTGWTRLNDAGDRASGAFDFQGVCPGDGAYGWRHVGTYEPTADGVGLITFSGC